MFNLVPELALCIVLNCFAYWFVLFVLGFWDTQGVRGTRRHPVYPGWKKEAKDQVDDSSVPKKGKVGLRYLNLKLYFYVALGTFLACACCPLYQAK